MRKEGFLDWDDSNEDNERQSNSAYILRQESTGFAHRSDMGYDRQRGVKANSGLFLA